MPDTPRITTATHEIKSDATAPLPEMRSLKLGCNLSLQRHPSERNLMKTLLSKEDLHDGVMRMADKIASCYANRQLTIVGVLTGSVVLMADLIRLIDLPMRVGVLQASSYRGATTTR